MSRRTFQFTTCYTVNILQSLVLKSLQNTHTTPWKPASAAVMVDVNLELIFQPQINLSRLYLVLCCPQISLACVFEDKNLSVFRSLRTLRALRPLRAISRMEGMKVTDAEIVF